MTRRLAVDRHDRLFVADGCRLYGVSTDDDLLHVAGTGVEGWEGDGGPAVDANLGHISGVAVDSHGSVYISDLSTGRVRKIGADGIISLVAGGYPHRDYGPPGAFRRQVPRVTSELHFHDQTEWRSWVRREAEARGLDESEFLDLVRQRSLLDDPSGIPALEHRLLHPSGLATDRAGNLFVAEEQGFRVLRILPGGRLDTAAGIGRRRRPRRAPSQQGDGGYATTAAMWPSDVVVDGEDRLLIADRWRVRRVGHDRRILSIAGGGWNLGDGKALKAAFEPAALALGPDGSTYIADGFSATIRIVREAPGYRHPPGVARRATVIGTLRERDGSPWQADRWNDDSFDRSAWRPYEISGTPASGLALDSRGNVFARVAKGLVIIRPDGSSELYVRMAHERYAWAPEDYPAPEVQAHR